MNKIFYIFFVLFIFCNKIAHSEVVNSIKINGNERISEQSIIVFGEIELGQNLDAVDLNDVIKKLYKTNFFENVSLNLQNNILEISIIENPLIQSVIIEGIKKKNIKKVLFKNLNLKDKSPYVEYLAEKDSKNIKYILNESGFYFANIKTSLKKNNNNTIDLIYDIDLGKKSKITKINFIGNKVFKNKNLRNIIVSEEDRFWKFISNKKLLNAQRIELDERLLRNFYKNKGFYLGKVDALTTSFLDNGSFELTFNIDAGEKFYFNDLSITLPDSFDPKYFDKINKQLIDLKGEVYSFKIIEKILDNIDQIALNEQFEFVQATVEESVIDNNKLDLVIQFSESPNIYVEKINIFGNTITRENVIRDELIVDEGDPFNQILFNKSINNIKGLNYFKTVKVDINEGSSEESKIISLTVEEKPTGEISLGAGVGSSGASSTFGVKENNFLGKGIKLNTNIFLSEESVKGAFNIINPNFRNSEKDLIFNIDTTETDRLANFGYKNNKTSLGFGTAYEQFDDIWFKPYLNTYYESITTSSTASSNLKKQEGDYFETRFGYSFNQDKTNQSFRPTDGYTNKFSQDVPLISEKYTLINGYEFINYIEYFDNLLFKANFYAKNATALVEDEIKVSERLYLSEKRLRGFEFGKIGPRDGGDFVGGNNAASLNLSSTLPFLQSFENTDVSTFFDVASVWGVDYDSTADKSDSIRSSAGLALNFFTPIGPLNFSLAQPLSKQSSDVTQTFRFNLGTSF